MRMNADGCGFGTGERRVSRKEKARTEWSAIAFSRNWGNILQCFTSPKLGGGQEWDGRLSVQGVFACDVVEGSVSCITQLI